MDHNDHAELQQRRETMKQIGQQATGTVPAVPDGTGTLAWMEARIVQAAQIAAAAGVTVDGVTVLRIHGGPDTVTVETPQGAADVPVDYVDPSLVMTDDVGHVFFVELEAQGATSLPIVGFNCDGMSFAVVQAAHDLWLTSRPENPVQVAAAVLSEPNE